MRAQRIFQFILFAYPHDFRRDFGRDMVQVFTDSYRVERRAGRRFGIALFWLRTSWDCLKTVPQEHLDRIRKDKLTMTSLRKDLTGLFACLAIIVAAFLLLSYGRKYQVSSILMFGYALDAIVVMGVTANAITFLVARFSKLERLRATFWILLAVHALPVAFLAIAGGTDPNLKLLPVVVGYIASFLFWLGLHWTWSQTIKPAQTAS